MSKRRGPTPRRGWQPLLPASPRGPHAEKRAAQLRESGETLWMNDRYTVTHGTLPNGGQVISIRRNDRKPIRDWRDFQRIKNQLCGPEAEGVELYPAESRLMDTANQFWLWVLPDQVRFPFGFDEGRVVADEAGEITVDGEPIDITEGLPDWQQELLPNARQRPGVTS